MSLKEYEWKLSDVQDAQGRQYLLDDETKVGGWWGCECEQGGGRSQAQRQGAAQDRCLFAGAK
jgi:hypothetical protein